MDEALFSLDPMSPLGAPSNIFYTDFSRPFDSLLYWGLGGRFFAAADEFSLLRTDNLNALDIYISTIFGNVDLADFNTWLASGGGGWAGADFNGDASIDLADFNIWLTTVPPTAPLMDAVPVPEPMTMAMFGLVGLLAAGRRRRTAPIRRSV